MTRTWWVLLCLACAPTAPCVDQAELVDGAWWYVTRCDRQICHARPYMVPERDTAAEAITECRGEGRR